MTVTLTPAAARHVEKSLVKRGKEELLSTEIAYVRVLKECVLLVAQEQKVEIRNGSEMLVKTGDILKENQTIATFDPFADPNPASAFAP